MYVQSLDTIHITNNMLGFNGLMDLHTVFLSPWRFWCSENLFVAVFIYENLYVVSILAANLFVSILGHIKSLCRHFQ